MPVRQEIDRMFEAGPRENLSLAELQGIISDGVILYKAHWYGEVPAWIVSDRMQVGAEKYVYLLLGRQKSISMQDPFFVWLASSSGQPGPFKGIKWPVWFHTREEAEEEYAIQVGNRQDVRRIARKRLGGR